MEFANWWFLHEGMTIEPYFSKAHIFAVTFFLVHIIVLAIYLGRKYKNNPKAIEIVLKISAFIMIAMYIFEITDNIAHQFVIKKLTLDTAEGWKTFAGHIINNAPLYLCDFSIFVIPIIAFSKGKVRAIASDFMAIWGIPMGIIGTYLAGNIFGRVPVMSFDGLLAIFLHVIPAGVTVFLYVTKIATLEKKNAFLTTVIFMAFMLFVLLYDNIFGIWYKGVNFMFFYSGDGTPFDLFRPYVPLPVYQIIVYTLYASYMILFYLAYYGIKDSIAKRHKNKVVLEPVKN